MKSPETERQWNLTEAELRPLFFERPSQEARDTLITAFWPLSLQTARGAYGCFGREVVDECTGLGGVGLIAAVDAYAPLRGPFLPYARRRIQGAMKDGLRKIDPVSRLTRDIMRKLPALMERLESSLGRPPTIEELAAEVGRGKKVVERARFLLANSPRISLDDADPELLHEIEIRATISGSSLVTVDPFSEPVADEDEISAPVKNALEKLHPVEREVLLRNVAGKESLSEIGRSLSLSESRMSQRKKTGLRQMKILLGTHENFRSLSLN